MSSESIASYTTLVLLLFLIFVILVAGLWLYNQYNLLIAIYYNDLLLHFTRNYDRRG